MGIIICVMFAVCGVFFLFVGLFFPGMQVKEIDQAKMKANMTDAITGKEGQQAMFSDDPYQGEPQKPFISD